MKRPKTYTFVAVIFLAAALACRHTPPTVVTPQGKVAFQFEDAVVGLNTLQHSAIELNKAGKLSDDATYKVVRYRRRAVNVIDAAIDNGTGKAAVYADIDKILQELERELGTEKTALTQALASLRVVLSAVSSAQVDPVLFTFGEGLALQLIAWVRRRRAEGKEPPNDAEVIAFVRSEIQRGNAEGEAWARGKGLPSPDERVPPRE